MPLPLHRPFADKYLTCKATDLGTAQSAFVIAPTRGEILQIYGVNDAQATTTAAVVTPKINGTAIAGASMTFATTDAAGTVKDVVPTAANFVEAGDKIEFASDGGPANVVPAAFTVVVREF